MNTTAARTPLARATTRALPSLINRLRAESVEAERSEAKIHGKGSMRKSTEAMSWSIWRQLYSKPGFYHFFRWTATRLRGLTPPRVGAWTRYRSAPKPAAKSLEEMARQQGFDHE